MHPSKKTPQATPAPIPETGFVRLPQILSVIPICKSSWWAGVRDGRFPAPVSNSVLGRVTVWRAEDIHELLARTGGVK